MNFTAISAVLRSQTFYRSSNLKLNYFRLIFVFNFKKSFAKSVFTASFSTIFSQNFSKIHAIPKNLCNRKSFRKLMRKAKSASQCGIDAERPAQIALSLVMQTGSVGHYFCPVNIFHLGRSEWLTARLNKINLEQIEKRISSEFLKSLHFL